MEAFDSTTVNEVWRNLKRFRFVTNRYLGVVSTETKQEIKAGFRRLGPWLESIEVKEEWIGDGV